MKKIKFYFLPTILSLAMAAFTLSACGGGDDESDDNDGDDNGGGKGSFSTEYVDLGLSVKWATCNLGATKPGEFGNYYAWGETSPKSNYRWNTYKWCTFQDYFGDDIVDKITKYCTNRAYGFDGKTTLESSDDAATVNLGKKWRMPTNREWKELVTGCVWDWTTKNGSFGFQVMGPNGKSIFLPAAGYREETWLIDDDDYGCYWSSSLDTNGAQTANCLYFHLESTHRTDTWTRYKGLPIRPVRP